MNEQTETTMSFVLTADIDEYLRQRARHEDRSLSAVLRRIMLEEIKRQPVPEPATNTPAVPR